MNQYRLRIFNKNELSSGTKIGQISAKQSDMVVTVEDVPDVEVR